MEPKLFSRLKNLQRIIFTLMRIGDFSKVAPFWSVLARFGPGRTSNDWKWTCTGIGHEAQPTQLSGRFKAHDISYMLLAIVKLKLRITEFD